MPLDKIINSQIFADNEIFSIRYFGSFCREDYGVSSDIDILCISSFSENKKKLFNARIKELISDRASVSFYQPERISLMYTEGHLFAWHLYSESKKVFSEDLDFIDTLGIPAKYTGCLGDIKNFIDIIQGSRVAIKGGNSSIVYEAGLLYLCARNISMCGSYIFSRRVDFSKYSPYNIDLNSFLQFPVDKIDYEYLIAARHSATRGFCIDSTKKINVLQIAEKIENWANGMLDLVRRKI